MILKTDRSLVHGYLRSEGRRMVNGNGQEILLRGVGLGNYMLPEGYMWKFYSPRADRPRRIEAVTKELLGQAGSAAFWQAFRRDYITEEDIAAIAGYGFNSIRLPFNWNLFLEDEPRLVFRSEGFEMIDRVLDWCEKHSLYCYLDLHGAPGGQTGANIDDSLEDLPRLLIDEEFYNKGIALWEELAKRYSHRWIVAGYDLLNEPVKNDFKHLNEKLLQFYRDATAAIRRHDKLHQISIEGAHWATDFSFINERVDDNMVLHFHRYWSMVHPKMLRDVLELSEKLDVPLWLGESGENCNAWFTAMFPMCIQHNIGWNFWTWKKMDTSNSPCSIRSPKGWDKVQAYLKQGPKPSAEEAERIFAEYLENMKYANCDHHPEVINHLTRRPDLTIPGIYYDYAVGGEKPFRGSFAGENEIGFRAGEGFDLVRKNPDEEIKNDRGDNPNQKYALLLRPGDFVTYTIETDRLPADAKIGIALLVKSAVGAEIALSIGDASQGILQLQPGEGFKRVDGGSTLPSGAVSKIRIEVLSGSVALDEIIATAIQ